MGAIIMNRRKKSVSVTEERCNVIFTGRLRSGFQLMQVKRSLVDYLHIQESRVDRLFSGRSRCISEM